MLLVDANGNTYRAHFRHVVSEATLQALRNPERLSSIKRPPTRWWATTECTLHAGQCVTVRRPCETPGCFTGIAKCSGSDQFDRRKGLKLAFERALWQMYGDSQELRQQLWASFWTRVRKPRHG